MLNHGRIISRLIQRVGGSRLLNFTSAQARSQVSLGVRISALNFATTRNAFIFRKMGNSESGLADTTGIERPNKITLSDEEWKAKLTAEEYKVCRKHGTEPAWTGSLLENKDKGTYVCTCCGTDLFNSSTKFDSGSGWPSFFDTLKDKDAPDLPAIDTRTDTGLGMVRTEVLCGKCDAHLGHVFNDGPKPTGLRYCINSVCLKFKSDKSTTDRAKKSEL